MLLLLVMSHIPFYYTDAAREYRIDPLVLYALCGTESNHRPKARRIMDGNSPSYGMCQIKINTAKLVGYKGSVTELYQPEVNVRVAAKYLKKQLDRYGTYEKALSAYNAGTYTIANFEYVNKVLKERKRVYDYLKIKRN